MNSWRSALEPSNGSSRSWERVCWNELSAASHHFDRGHKSSTVSEWPVTQQLAALRPRPPCAANEEGVKLSLAEPQGPAGVSR
jgi:hypothetical protein